MPDASGTCPELCKLMCFIRLTTVSLRIIQPSSIPSRLHPYRQFFASPTNSSRAMSEFYNLKAKLPGDKEYDFEQLKGKVVLVVNVASKW